MPRAPADVGGPELKSWGELRAGQKVARAGRNFVSIAIIGFGLGLAATVIYTVASSFRSNSPSKLYGQAFDLVRADPEVSEILIAPLRCHGDTVTMGGGRSNKRSRGRPTTTVESDDRMTIRFHVVGLTEAERDASWWQRARRFAHELIYAPSSPSQVVVHAPEPTPAPPPTPQPSYMSSFYAWLSSLVAGILPGSLSTPSNRRKSRAAASIMPAIRPVRPARGAVTTGEVTCRLQKNTSGEYVFKSITVDFPGAQRPVWLL